MDRDIIAQAFGFISLFLGLATVYQKDDRRLKWMMLLLNCNHALHFALMGAATACISASIGVGRSLISLHANARLFTWPLIGLTTLMGLTALESIYGLLPIIASSIGTYALFNLRGVMMRYFLLVGACLWLANNLWVGSIGGSLLEIAMIATNSMTIYRLKVDERQLVNQSSI
ncbi:YgjV family protein [Vibrio hepatarius]|uniref:YgjV family protein n=1 Tax=Vibrio hepatarius TaxID=171383 RepID=UPI00142DBA79|nr:YgjV family protein [Vibrio hepatarius]NIY84068.1 YgjV family protein [Vibrio hepatarius]